MRSQVIKIRNLPDSFSPVITIQVKPIGFLFLLITLGSIVMIREGFITVSGLFLVILPVFALLVMPDRRLAECSEDCLVLYNQRERDACMLIYWDEIVKWQYEWHPSADLLVVSMVDGSTQTMEMYSKFRIARAMNQYAPGKEVRTTRTKDERI
ncbi:MAG: hypothetical protein IJ120_06025 [Solobacterium sp.]|nr:hypothetical protein [Solobacterium sp.]